VSPWLRDINFQLCPLSILIFVNNFLRSILPLSFDLVKIHVPLPSKPAHELAIEVIVNQMFSMMNSDAWNDGE
jgi:hypothetical protein